jgi:HemY protein
MPRARSSCRVKKSSESLIVRAVFWLLVLATLAVVLSMAARYNDGYVLLVLFPWRIELSLNFFIVLTLGLFAVGHLILLGLRHTLSLPVSVAAFRRQRAKDRAADQVQEAMRLLIEGRYGHAMRQAEQAWPEHPQSGMVSLIGWRAAHALRDAEQTRVWRQRALAAGKDIDTARLMTEAELAVEERRFGEALIALRQLGHKGRRHIAAMRLQLRAEQGAGNWQEAARLVRQLEKAKALTPDQAAPLRQRAVREALRGFHDDQSGLQRFWRELDDADRAAPALALETARALAAAGDCREAQRVIEDALEERWDPNLVTAYAECPGGDVLGRIAHAEKWLSLYPRDEALLLTLGRLCREQKLWGKARSFMEASIAVLPSRAAHLELASLLDELQNSALAGRHYRAAALLGDQSQSRGGKKSV